MSEGMKTSVFGAVALAAALVAFVATRPAARPLTVEDETGQKLFQDFVDPLAAVSLEIIEYDEETATPRSFVVREINDRWSIPSHADYPTDAQDQLAQAAGSVMDLKILGVASKQRGDHELYGVVDPDPKTGEMKSGAVGVGTKVVMEDGAGAKLARLVIGKEVKDRPEQRYVRRENQDPVYVVAVDDSKLSTKFADWIEQDLLKMSAFDIQSVSINDYSIDEAQGAIQQRGRLELTYDDAAPTDERWSLTGLAEGEKVDQQKLNALRDALDELKIVDVRRKPAGLSAELRTEEGMRLDQEAVISLASRGFIIAQGRLWSNEGEVVARMKDGVEYILRFGEIAADTETEGEDEAAADAESSDSTSGGANRYIFVTAEFNPDLIPPPELEELPGENSTDASAGDAAVEDAPNAEESTAADEPAAAEEAETTGEDATATAEAETPPGESSEADPADDQEPAAEVSGDEASEETGADDETEPVDEVERDIERERIETENKRKQDAHEAKLEEGRAKAKELNDRFADWYYVISDSMYRKIHLGRADILVDEPPADEGTESGDAAADAALDSLQQFEELKRGLADESAPE